MVLVLYTKYFLLCSFIIISPWLIRIIYNNFVRCIPQKNMPLTSHILIMIVFILLKFVSFCIPIGPFLISLPAYINILSIVGFFLNILPVCLHLMIIGVPCAYLDTLVRDLNIEFEIDEDEIENIVHEYKKFQKLAGSYLFLIYSCFSCMLIVAFYHAAIFISCYPQQKVNIISKWLFIYIYTF